MRKAILTTWALALIANAGWGQLDRNGLYRLELSATPQQVAADGQSQARLRIDVRNQNGLPAADGTQVVVHTDLGEVSLSGVGRQPSLTARTSGGFVVVFVTSSNSGTATVTAQVADSRASTHIDFLPEGEAAEPEARVLDVTGSWVGYSVDLNLIEARDRARVTFGKLVIEAADFLQIDVANMTLKAQGVVVRRGNSELKGEDLYFDLAAKRGVLRRFGKQTLERVYFDALAVRPLPNHWNVPDDAFHMDRRNSDTWLVARSASLFVREKIVLRHAALWIQDQKMFTFPPYWIIGLPGYTGTTNSQALGLSTDGGIAIDFPFFFQVTDKQTGSIKLERGARASDLSSRDGWAIGVEEEYRNGSGTDGSVDLDGLTRSDWGLSWTDSRPMFGNGFSYASLDLPDHKSVFADANIYRYQGQGRVSLRGYFDAPVDYNSTFGLLGDWLSNPIPVGDHNLSYRLGTTVGMARYTDEPGIVGVNDLHAELSLGQRPWGKRTTLTPLISNTFSWDTGGYAENSLEGDLQLNHLFSPTFNIGLDYNAQLRRGNGEDVGFDHLLTLDLRASRGAKWSTYMSSTYGLNSSTLYSYLTFDYYLNQDWRWGLAGTYYDLDQATYRDVDLSLGRMFGGREISLNYSTDTHRIYLSLGGLATQ